MKSEICCFSDQLDTKLPNYGLILHVKGIIGDPTVLIKEQVLRYLQHELFGTRLRYERQFSRQNLRSFFSYKRQISPVINVKNTERPPRVITPTRLLAMCPYMGGAPH